MQKKYNENHLKPYAVKSINTKGRFFNEFESNIRSPYQRDRDRIIHSSSFRRLKHKTQVFVNTTGDHYRTRLTHSMEVSQIARTLARYLGLNEDLSETLSLSHDLGHTPFGHAGEEILKKCMKQYFFAASQTNARCNANDAPNCSIVLLRKENKLGVNTTRSQNINL